MTLSLLHSPSSLHTVGVCIVTSVLQFAGQLRVCVGAGCPWKSSIKGGVQHLVQVSGGDEVEVSSDVGWKLLKVLLVAFREDDALHSCPVGREHLVLDPPHLRWTDQSSVLNLSIDLHLLCVKCECVLCQTHRQHQAS